MLVECCFRLIPHGEVIHSQYDSDALAIIGMPLKWYDVRNLALPEYSKVSYRNNKFKYDLMVETVLLSNPNYALVVENNNIGYYVLCFDGTRLFIESSLDSDKNPLVGISPNFEDYVAVGYRRTKQVQIRSCDGVYRFVYDKRDNVFVTQDGILVPEFDVSNLSKVSFNYAGYKDMIKQGYYAVVYIDDKPVMVEKTHDNRLKLL